MPTSSILRYDHKPFSFGLMDLSDCMRWFLLTPPPLFSAKATTSKLKSVPSDASSLNDFYYSIMGLVQIKVMMDGCFSLRI